MFQASRMVMSCNFYYNLVAYAIDHFALEPFDVLFVCLFVYFIVGTMHNCTWVGKLCIVFRLKQLMLNIFLLFYCCLSAFKYEISKPSIKVINKMENKTKWQRDAAIENKNHALHVKKRTDRKKSFYSFRSFERIHL